MNRTIVNITLLPSVF